MFKKLLSVMLAVSLLSHAAFSFANQPQAETIMQAIADAKADVKTRENNAPWILGGCFCGLWAV